ncbi:MAG: hypothetical protein HY776_09020 [Actinobacteria bacterium]|nr:hypothetical protein [Actinomycetota bacterium]
MMPILILKPEVFTWTQVHPYTETTAGLQPASTEAILGHKIGHVATGVGDEGQGRMNNVNQNENPIRRELGEPERTAY